MKLTFQLKHLHKCVNFNKLYLPNSNILTSVCAKTPLSDVERWKDLLEASRDDERRSAECQVKHSYVMSEFRIIYSSNINIFFCKEMCEMPKHPVTVIANISNDINGDINLIDYFSNED